MFFPIPSQPMGQKEEFDILEATGCPKPIIDILLSFADKYRQSMSADNVLKNRKLGTRSLVRIARRIAFAPEGVDLYAIIHQSLLAEFLPATEKINLNTLLEDCNIFKRTAAVCLLGFSPLLGNDIWIFLVPTRRICQREKTSVPRPQRRLW